ncbi:MAG: carboxylate--amine ligase [Lagierella massiliensis]|nr:carboxylate--amine ligase [Lagierella massiliensis]
MTKQFIPIILGTDINSYGVARSFHEAYGIKSIAFGMKPLPFTADSKIVDVRTFNNFDSSEVFVRELEDFGKKMLGKTLLLISCSDGYTSLLTENADKLKRYYTFNYIPKNLQEKLENKKDFYEICEKYNLNYPATYIIDRESKDNYKIPFEYPVAIKANDSIEFLNLKFPGKKKAYKAKDEMELNQIIQDVYAAGYTGEMIIQDFIPGDHSTMGVLNAYVNSKGEVKMMCFGKCLLDECLPEGIGNYNALVTEGNEELYSMVKSFLEKINYRGFANFDFKYDRRDGKYKVFEINIRQGRSSYYMTAGGCNFVTFLVDDLIDNTDKPIYKHTEEGLWIYVDPFVLKNYCNKTDLPRVKRLLEKGFKFTQWYEKDKNFKRWLNYWRRRLATIKYYPKFQPEREEI